MKRIEMIFYYISRHKTSVRLMGLIFEFDNISKVEIGNRFDWTSGSYNFPEIGSDFENSHCLTIETDGKLTNADLKQMAKKNMIDIPQDSVGRLDPLLVIYCDDEPLIFYPQKRDGKEITIEKFLLGLKEGKVESLALESTSKLLREALISWGNSK